MKYINKRGLTYLKDTIKQETKTEIEKATNKVLPINFYKFSSTEEMYSVSANDGDIGIFCGEVEEGVSENTSFKNIIIKDSIDVIDVEALSENATSYYFYTNFNQKLLEVTISTSEIKITVKSTTLSDSDKIFIYQPSNLPGALKNEYLLISGETGQINFSSNISFITRNNENKWNSVLYNVLTYKQKKVEMYMHNENTTRGYKWEKIVTVDNSYVTEGIVKVLINQALANNSSS